MVDDQAWSGMSCPLPESDSAMAAHLEPQLDDPSMLPFAVEQTGRFVGRTSFYDLVPNVRVDIGHTIYARDVWGSHVNPRAKLLLLTSACDQFQVERVGMCCDHRNTRSHRAIAHLGATFEGTLRRVRPTRLLPMWTISVSSETTGQLSATGSNPGCRGRPHAHRDARH